MEEPLKDQTAPPCPVSPPANSAGKQRLQRYPLRSTTKSKEGKTPGSDSSASIRGRTPSSISKSVSALEFSGKDKSAKPPRRQSTPAKSVISPVRKTTSNITPIPEVRAKRPAANQGRSETPRSDITGISSRRNTNDLFRASHWLSQIKLSESAEKHSISLGLFKLALEAGCEPLQLLRDELKSYARRHNLAEFAELLKQLLESYNISESLDQLQVSETCSQAPEEGTRSSEDDVNSSTSTVDSRKLKPKSLNADTARNSAVRESVKKDGTRKSGPTPRTRQSMSGSLKSVLNTSGRKAQKNLQKPNKQEVTREKEKIKEGNKSVDDEGPVSPLPVDNVSKENKENVDAPSMEEISLA